MTMAGFLPVASAGLLTPPRFELGYVTDCEGNLAYFDRWVSRSGVLRYRAGTDDVLELTHENAFFVYVRRTLPVSLKTPYASHASTS